MLDEERRRGTLECVVEGKRPEQHALAFRYHWQREGVSQRDIPAHEKPPGDLRHRVVVVRDEEAVSIVEARGREQVIGAPT